MKADFTNQHALTVKSETNPSFFTDKGLCEGCGRCVQRAAECFKMNVTQSYVYAQPVTTESESRCREAMIICPSKAIGDNGRDVEFVYTPPPVPPEPEPQPEPQPEPTPEP